MDKLAIYKKAIKEIKERIEGVNDIIPRMSTVAAVLKNTIPYFFWCGFYFAEEDKLVIGPYQGTSACAEISYSGVCGTSAKQKKSLIVKDVHKFPGHIACDERSKSEIVIPLKDKEDRIIGVFDVDAAEYNAFDEIDRGFLEDIIHLVLEE